MKSTFIYALLGCCLLAAGCKKNQSPIAAGQANKSSAKKVTVGEMSGTLPSLEVYRFVTHNTAGLSPQKALGPVGGAGAVNLAQMVQKGVVNSNMGQAWRLKLLPNGKYTLICQNTLYGLCVLYGQAVNGRALILVPYNESDVAQQWIVTYDSGSGSYRLKTALPKMIPTDPDYGIYVDNNNEDAPITLGVLTNTKSLFKVYRTAYKDNPATDFFKRMNGWGAGDGATSILLNNGKVMWLMDDSGIDNVNQITGTIPCNFTVNNCAIMQQSVTNWDWTTAPTLVGGGAPYGLFRSNTSTPAHYNWTSSGFELSGIAYVFCGSVQSASPYPVAAPPDAFGKFQVSTNTVIGYQNLKSFYRADLDAADGAGGNGIIGFGKGFVKDGSYIYAYGAHKPSVSGNLYLARFAATTAGIAGYWDYWNGSGWVTDNAAGVGLNAAAVIGVSDSPAPLVCKVGSKYVMVSAEFSAGCNQGSRIFTNSSSNPYGPFNIADRKLVYTISDNWGGNRPWFYWAQGHPEHNLNNELLITYNLNGLPGCEVCNGAMDSDKYRPKAIRVPFKLIDPAL